MLVSAVIELRPMRESSLPKETSRAVHAWFLDRVRAADEALAEALHRKNKAKPFTVALHLGGRKGEHPWLRVTTLTGELSAVVTEKLLPELPAEVMLAGQRWQVLGATTDPASHPWAGRASYHSLAESYLLSGSQPEPWLRLEFATPTTFHSQGRHLPLPLPHLAVEGWLRKWNAFGPLSLTKEMPLFAKEDLAISRYRLHTEATRIGRTPVVGFVGRCDFRFLNKDSYRMRLLHLLSAYALYCGTGHKTTMGLGQTRQITQRATRFTNETN